MNSSNYEAAKHNLVATPSNMQLILPAINNNRKQKPHINNRKREKVIYRPAQSLFSNDDIMHCDEQKHHPIKKDIIDFDIDDFDIDDEDIDNENNMVQVEYFISKKQWRADITGPLKDEIVCDTDINGNKILTQDNVKDGFVYFCQDQCSQMSSCASHVWIGSKDGNKVYKFNDKSWKKAIKYVDQDNHLQTVLHPQVVMSLETLNCSKCEIMYLVSPSVKSALYKLKDQIDAFAEQREKKKFTKQQKAKKNKKKDKKFANKLKMTKKMFVSQNQDFSQFMKDSSDCSSTDDGILFNSNMHMSMSEDSKKKMADILQGKKKNKKKKKFRHPTNSNNSKPTNSNNSKPSSNDSNLINSILETNSDQKLKIIKLEREIKRLHYRFKHSRRDESDSESRSRSRSRGRNESD